VSTRRHSRREFVGLTGAGIAGLASAPFLGATSVTAATPAADAPDADLIVINAKVYTVDAAMPRAEAFAVKGGRFLAVGSSADMKALAGKSTQTFDAKGMTVVPGFTDCHNHAPGTTLLYEVLVAGRTRGWIRSTGATSPRRRTISTSGSNASIAPGSR